MKNFFAIAVGIVVFFLLASLGTYISIEIIVPEEQVVPYRQYTTLKESMYENLESATSSADAVILIYHLDKALSDISQLTELGYEIESSQYLNITSYRDQAIALNGAGLDSEEFVRLREEVGGLTFLWPVHIVEDYGSNPNDMRTASLAVVLIISIVLTSITYIKVSDWLDDNWGRS